MIYPPGKNGKNSITFFSNKFTCQCDKFPNKNKLKYAQEVASLNGEQEIEF